MSRSTYDRFAREASRAHKRVAALPVQRFINMPAWPPYLQNLEWRLSEDDLLRPQVYRIVPDIFAMVDLLASFIASLPLDFFQGDPSQGVKLERIPSNGLRPGNIVDLFANANELETGYSLMHALVSHFLLNGNGFQFLNMSALAPGSIKSIWTLPGHLVRPVLDDKHGISHFMFNNGNIQPIRLPKEQVIHFPDFTTELDGLGISRLEVLRLTYETSHDAQRYQREFYKRGGAAAGHYSTDQPLTQPERARLKEDFSVEVDGPSNAFKPVFLPRNLKFVRAGLTHAEMQFVETSKLTVDQFLRVFHIPPAVYGIKVGGLGGSDKGIAQDMVMFVDQAAKPICTRIASVLNERFKLGLGFDPNVTCAFDYSKIPAMQSVWLMQAEAYSKIVGTIMPVVEVRERLGLPELSPDELAKLEAPKTPPGGKDPGASGADSPNVPNDYSREAAVDETRDRVRVRESAKYEPFFEYALGKTRTLLSQQERRIAGRVKVEWKSTKRDDGRVELRYIDVDQLLLDLEDHPKDRALVEKLVRYIQTNAGKQAIAEQGLQVSLDLDVQRFIDAMKSQSNRFITKTSDTTKRALREALTESIAKNESLNDAVARVREVFNDRRANAGTIARTESHAAFNAGRIEGWRQGGLKKKEWLTARDEHVRGNPDAPESEFSHYDADGLVEDIDQPFLVGGHHPGLGEALMFPGDPHGSAGNVINCRCALLPVDVAEASQDEPIEEMLSR